MSERELLAAGLGAALLDGAWDTGPMFDRLARAVGEEHRWMAALVRAVRRAYLAPPLDAQREFFRWLQTRRAFAEAADAGTRIRRYFLPQARMSAPRWETPRIHTVADLASWLGIDNRALDALADRRGIAANYRYHWLAKPSGGKRLLEAPRPRLKAVQRRILDGIVAAIPPHRAAHGFRRGHSLLDFVAPHAGEVDAVTITAGVPLEADAPALVIRGRL